MNITRRRRSRTTAVLLGVLLGLVLAVPAASAQSGERAGFGNSQSAVTGSPARAVSALSGTSADAARLRQTSSAHRVAVVRSRKGKAGKKGGFLKKLGIFLLVVVVVVILIVVLLVWLLVRAVRRHRRRRAL
ncbi:hypothetical protein AAW14_12675 [Streptomyces hygroscopicus]|uniref:hypothetical protein n=1 Tax=Streptomyces hygroscopicus TaxID=1912 RepID=UPI00224032B7|nr:hypothetical protein [Streptomyces hygroscopicus]MCW7942872.1 hypothetical protein [Streptomyces hygroscopicus]